MEVFLTSKLRKKLLLCWIVLYHSQSRTEMMDLFLVLLEKGVLWVKTQLLEKTILKKSYISCVKTFLSRHKTKMTVPITMQYNMAIF